MQQSKGYIIFLFVFIAVTIVCPGCTSKKPNPKDCSYIDRQPTISPDYTETTLPPNIAPTNFIIKEKGKAYYVNISSEKGEQIDIFSQSSNIKIRNINWSIDHFHSLNEWINFSR